MSANRPDACPDGTNTPEHLGLVELDDGMYNMDHSIDDGVDEALRAGGTYCQHAAWNFCGYVWFADGQFHEEVWRYNSPQTIVSADSLAKLMEAVNAEWGSE